MKVVDPLGRASKHYLDELNSVRSEIRSDDTGENSMVTTTNTLLWVLVGVIAFFTTFLSDADIISF